jgi:hypothetical protein
MLCAIAAQSLATNEKAYGASGEKPYADQEASVLREGFIMVIGGA